MTTTGILRRRVRTSTLRSVASTVCVLALVLTSIVPGQQTAVATRRAITHSDYDSWKSIQFQQLSRDGKILAYALVPQDGDGEIVVRNLTTGTEWRHARGSRPDPTAQGEGTGEPVGPGGPPGPGGGGFGAGRGGAGGSQLGITTDSRFLVFTIFPTKDEVKQARKAKKRPEDMPKNALGIMDLSTGQVTRVDKVKRFQLPEEAAGFIAYSLEAKTEPRAPGAAPAAPRPEGAQPARPRTPRKEYGTDLILRNLADNTERTFADVLEFSFSDDGKSLVYTVSSKQEDTNGVYAVVPGTTSTPASLLAGKGKYSKLTWDEDAKQLVFVSDRDDAAAKQPKIKLYYWDRQAAAATEIVTPTTPGLGKDLFLSDRGNIAFSFDGSRIFFGIAPPPEPEKEEDDDTPAEEKVVVDLWHWKDDFIQPMQKVRANQERNRTYRAVYHVKEKKLVQLADRTLEAVNDSPGSDGRWVFGYDDRQYRRLVGVDSSYSDVYLVDTLDGSRKPLRQRQQFGLSREPNGKYALFFDGKDWNTISIPDGKLVNLTKNLGVAFWEEDNDSPTTPSSYGNGGWTQDGKSVLLYDQYDIWQVPADGAGRALNLTDGVGRKGHIEFRYVRLDPKERAIDPAKPLLLHAENEWTRESGFYRDRINGGLPEKLIMSAKSYGNPTKAKNAEVMSLTVSTFDQFPDLYITGPDFKELKKVTDANPQKSQLLWGKSELVRFKNTDGVPLSGILIKPENFDPQKKYPMIVYIYEKLSQGLHRFVNPAPGTSINASYYASNGYLVFMPDIVYTIGYPGQSALKCVLPGIQAVVDQGFVDEKAIGIQGHSWGGYQIAYMVTQTNRFRAAAPGALVANMTSAYSGIRWGTGLPRQFQYEHTQSRIGGSLWEYPMRYLENSPVFRADRVQTPILMIHNDGDDAVPWYQGIEYYLALRRLDKEVYMFNYNGEPHGLRKRQNQKDYTRRTQEFFDYFLKGAPKPAWMESGIPFIDREKEKEKYRTASDSKQTAQQP
jgi:dipeptidyl aminopeptidase/acylaminoacyl peptidase